MGTIILHQDGVLGLIALGIHWVMSTLRMQTVITGDLKSSWYCAWCVSGILVLIAVLVHELG